MLTDAQDTLFNDLVRLCKDAFAGGHYEAAYHILTGSVHYAKDIASEQHLRVLEQIAQEQSDWINAHAPDNVMSIHAARRRNGIDLYGMLLRQITASIRIVRDQARRQAQSAAFPSVE